MRTFSYKKFFKWTFLGGLCLMATGAIILAVLSYTLPDPARLSDRQIKQSTKIYDRTGKVLLYEIFNAQKRTVINIKDLPSYVIDATVAIEDKNFYNHHGIAWKSLARAIFSNVTGSDTGQGGASTLTQQFVKKAIVGDEHSLFRKVKEALLALKVERNYSKQEILELYFNEIPYGSTNYGVESAAQNYFGKSAKDISLAQAATLAALIQAPTRYLNNIPRLTSRRDYVLQVMAEQNYITKQEKETAQKETVVINPQGAGAIAPHFIMMVKEQLTDVFGIRTVEEGGLTVITTLDAEKQKIAQEEVVKAVEKNRKQYNAQNAALVALDTKSGDILSMVGSRNFFDKEYDGQVNVALRPRQPGSSFKPLVYLLGFEKGYTPATILYDVKTAFKTDGADYSPNDYDLGERGPVTLRKALQGSLNIPAVKMLYLVGIDTVLSRAHDLGYTTLNDRSRFGLSLVLGGGEVTLLEHTNVFATYARGGQYLPTQSILEVRDAGGSTMYKKPEATPKQVLDADAVATLSNVLSDNAARAYVFGENSSLQLGDRPVAAKTGTTNDYRDGWLMGYTPSLAVGVWAGNNDNTPMNRAGGSLAGGGLWNGFMKRALDKTPIEQFPPLPTPKTTKGILLGYDPAFIEVEIDSASGKLVTEFTPPEARATKKYFVGHSILNYINPADPLGDPPANPAIDPQFERWEAGIRNWATRNNMNIEAPPTQFDDVHTAETQQINPPNPPVIEDTSPPTIQWTTSQGFVIPGDGTSFELTANITHPNQIRRMRLIERVGNTVQEIAANIEPAYVWHKTLDTLNKISGTHRYYLELDLTNGDTFLSDPLIVLFP